MTDTNTLAACPPLPCPFCGGAPSKAEEDGVTAYVSREHASENWMVRCDFCGAQSRDTDTKAEAITAWNTRQPTAPWESAATILGIIAALSVGEVDRGE